MNVVVVSQCEEKDAPQKEKIHEMLKIVEKTFNNYNAYGGIITGGNTELSNSLQNLPINTFVYHALYSFNSFFDSECLTELIYPIPSFSLQ